jgi:hypothetical protein
VKDAFFRIACLAFDKIISQELEAKTTTQPRKAAGSFSKCIISIALRFSELELMPWQAFIFVF